MKKKSVLFLLIVFVLCSTVIGLVGCTNHTHVFDMEIISRARLASEATCTSKATYYYSCTCGKMGEETFEVGEVAEHEYDTNWSYDKTHHWHTPLCACTENIDIGEHSFVDNVCTTCGANYIRFLFDGGIGTEEDPYIISNVEELANIAIVPEFSYYKVKDGVEELDLSDWTAIRLNGSFDGNGVKLVNLSTRLFTHVGNNEEKEIYLKNFEVTINFVSSTHAALIKEIDNFGTTVFEDVKIHGYIEGESNTAALFSFGTNNGYDGGSNYTVELNNVKIDATIVCVTGQPLAAFIAHSFPGANNKLTLKVDDETEFTGEVYSAGDKKYNEYVSIGTYEIYKEGVLITQSEIETKPINKVVPELTEEGYFVTADENVDKITVSITAQISAYDEDDNVIPSKVGITMTFTTKDITEGLDGSVKVLDKFGTATIVNNANGYDAQIDNGVLTIYVAQSVSYESGTVRLQVQQYNEQGDIISCGTLNIYNFVK